MIEKDRVCVPLGLVWGKVGERLVCFSVCGASLYNWANGGCDVLLW